MVAELEEALRFRGPGEAADGVGRALDRREQVELPSRLPGVTGEDVETLEVEMCIQRGAGTLEDLVEDGAEREDGRARVDVAPRDVDDSKLAAGRRRALQDGDLQSLGRQHDGGHEARDTGAHDRDPARLHASPPPSMSLPRTGFVFTR